MQSEKWHKLLEFLKLTRDMRESHETVHKFIFDQTRWITNFSPIEEKPFNTKHCVDLVRVPFYLYI